MENKKGPVTKPDPTCRKIYFFFFQCIFTITSLPFLEKRGVLRFSRFIPM
jgi:hypothetical protein